MLLSIHGGLLAWEASRHGFTWTEVGLLPAGVIHWQTGKFDVYRVNPPLVRMVGALPVLLVKPEMPEVPPKEGLKYRPEWGVGRRMIEKNGERAFQMLTLARWACIPFSLLGAYVCFRWARELYGELSGLAGLTLWSFSPNILAHGQLITGDVAAAALGAAASYLFWHWLKVPDWKGAVIAGLMLGFAELTKTTWVVLFPLWPTIWLLWRWSEHRYLLWAGWGREIGQLATIVLLSVYVLNLGYGFEGSFTKLGDYRFLSRVLAGNEAHRESGGNRFHSTILSEVPVPLPKNYVQGADLQKWDFETTRWSYLRGQWRTRGWWYYYLYALVIKMPIGTLILLVLAVIGTGWRPGFRAPWRDEVVLLTPAVVILVLVSCQLGLNKHLRYVLPSLPFLFIWMSKVAMAIPLGRKAFASAASLALSWAILSSLWVFPHSLSYFNELVGGPKNGDAHLHSSNIDWGQDLFYLKHWLEEHPAARPVWLAYYLYLVDPGVIGLDYPVCPKGLCSETEGMSPQQLGPWPGWHVVSVCQIRRQSGWYRYFLEFTPVDTVGYSMNVYHITLQEANRVRGRLGLPELSSEEVAIEGGEGDGL